MDKDGLTWLPKTPPWSRLTERAPLSTPSTILSVPNSARSPPLRGNARSTRSAPVISANNAVPGAATIRLAANKQSGRRPPPVPLSRAKWHRIELSPLSLQRSACPPSEIHQNPASNSLLRAPPRAPENHLQHHLSDARNQSDSPDPGQYSTPPSCECSTFGFEAIKKKA